MNSLSLDQRPSAVVAVDRLQLLRWPCSPPARETSPAGRRDTIEDPVNG